MCRNPWWQAILPWESMFRLPTAAFAPRCDRTHGRLRRTGTNSAVALNRSRALAPGLSNSTPWHACSTWYDIVRTSDPQHRLGPAASPLTSRIPVGYQRVSIGVVSRSQKHRILNTRSMLHGYCHANEHDCYATSACCALICASKSAYCK